MLRAAGAESEHAEAWVSIAHGVGCMYVCRYVLTTQAFHIRRGDYGFDPSHGYRQESVGWCGLTLLLVGVGGGADRPIQWFF